LGHSQLHHLVIRKPLSGKKTPPSVLSMFFHVENGASLPCRILRYALFSAGKDKGFFFFLVFNKVKKEM